MEREARRGFTSPRGLALAAGEAVVNALRGLRRIIVPSRRRLQGDDSGVSTDESSLALELNQGRVLAERTQRMIVNHVRSAGRTAASSGRGGFTRVSILANAILASDFRRGMESWLGKAFNEGVPSIYDKAADAAYNASHYGGGQLHRLFDGNHTLWGMWDAAREALPDDTLLQEIVGYATAAGKDLSSHVGLPLLGMTRDSYNQVAALTDTFHIPRAWTQDMLHVNGVELVGTAIATLAVALHWTSAETEEFARVAGSLGVSAVASANPTLALVTLAVFAKAFMQAKNKGDYVEAVEGLAKGGVGTGLFLVTASAVTGPISGPVWLGMVAGLCAAAVTHRVTRNVHVSDVAAFVQNLAGSAPATLRRTMAHD